MIKDCILFKNKTTRVQNSKKVSKCFVPFFHLQQYSNAIYVCIFYSQQRNDT